MKVPPPRCGPGSCGPVAWVLCWGFIEGLKKGLGEVLRRVHGSVRLHEGLILRWGP